MNSDSKLNMSKLFTVDKKSTKNKSNIISKNKSNNISKNKSNIILEKSKTILDNPQNSNINNSSLLNTNIKPISSVESNDSKNSISVDKLSTIKDDYNIFNPTKIILLILIFILFLSILGFNLFGYIGEKIDFFNQNLNPLNNIIDKYFFNTSKAIINNSSKGSEIVIDKSKKQINKIKEKTQIKKKQKKEDKVDASDTDSNNFCYIGKHKGIRYCEKMGDNNKQCVSNSIYPSMEQCINNNLK
tara:strand:+ start:1272 stop:2003 length:732 start_codon:yes stop_codon:yes gene_type:complete